MDAQSFLNNFGYIAEAPDGVDKLRELILSLAMQGKLLNQNSKDISASELLNEIAAEKQRLLKEKKITRPKKLIEIKPEEKRYTLPVSWEWVRFGNIAQHNAGKTLDKRRNTGRPRDYITTSNLYWGTFKLNDLRQMLIKDEELERCTARKGDLLVCEGGEAGRAAVWPYDNEISFQNHIHRCRFYHGVNPYYAYRFFEKINATGEINNYRKGVGISNMSGKALASIVFPLPPLEEQKRIVTKVDELMALCDRLEAQQQKRQRLFPVLSRTTHARLVESPTPANLKAIFDDIGTVSPDDLRKTIFSLAVRGKLVSRIPEESTSREMLNEISVKPIFPDGAPNIPNHWNWVTLGSVVEEMNSGWSPACLRYPADQDEWGVLKTTAVQSLEYQEDQNKKLPPTLDPRPKNEVVDGDILITRAGPKNRVGILCVARPTRPKLMISDKIIRFKLTSFIHPDYAALALNADFSNMFLDKLKSGMAESQMNISQPKLRTVPLPIPPKNEQLRILNKVDELIYQINHLEKLQAKKKELAQAFAQASVTAITGTQIKEQEKMKVPKTELVTKLQIGKKPKKADQAPLADFITKHKGMLSAKALWQQSGMKIDAFYQQLKVEMANGWITEPEKATMQEVGAR